MGESNLFLSLCFIFFERKDFSVCRNDVSDRLFADISGKLILTTEHYKTHAKRTFSSCYLAVRPSRRLFGR